MELRLVIALLQLSVVDYVLQSPYLITVVHVSATGTEQEACYRLMQRCLVQKVEGTNIGECYRI